MSIEAEKADYQVLLSSNYAIDTDKHNIVLKEKYQKKDGKGKHSNLIDEYGWRDLGYFRDMGHVADYIVNHEIMKERDVGELRRIVDELEALRDDIVDTLSERVTVVRHEGKREKG